MQPTLRFWEALAVAATLAVGSVVFAQPLLLLASVGIAAWLLASQLGFLVAIGRLDDSLTITQTVAREGVSTGDPVSVTIATDGEDAGLETSVTAIPSAGLDAAGDLQTQLGEATTYTVQTDVAGTHRIEAPDVEVRDPAGLFTERFTRGDPIQMIVDARRPRNVTVGEGGWTIPYAFGEHMLKYPGQGQTPAGLRRYVSGEPASNIDWKATARMEEPYVREFEAEADQMALLVVDARSGLNTGPPGETPLDYLRTVALAHAAVVQRLGDPLGCYGIDDRGVRQFTSPTDVERGYERTRRRLRGLTAATRPSHSRRPPPIQRRSPQFDLGTRFGQVLNSYATARPATDPESSPLQTAVRSAMVNLPGSIRFVVYTDDSDRRGIQEVVREIRRSDHSLNLFLTPTVLFDTDSLANLEAATEGYRDFEQFRTDLDAIDGVSAYEVAPQSRIETVLEREQSVAPE